MTATKVLKQNNIKPSVIRVMVYDFLCGTKTHPTVDTIYESIAKDVPTLSKTSVYNAVNLLLEKGLVKPITIDGFQTRYDADTSCHGHFLCIGCHRVYDFEPEIVMSKAPDGFVVNTREVYYSGICRDCNKK